MNLTPFDHTPRTRLVFGAGSLGQIGTLTAELGVKRVLVVTDPGIVAAGYAARAQTLLEAAGITVAVYDRVRENPTTEDVENCRLAALEAKTELFIGLGGGSSLDTAKGANFVLTNGGTMHDYWGTHKATKPMLPLIAVPTTAGTGSEMQSYALISDAETHVKMACGDPKAAAKIALLDPELTVSMPPFVTAVTGIDALVHTIETAVTKKRTPISAIYSREAFQLLIPNFARVIENPNDTEARGAMLLGAAYSGIAIENSMLGAAHSCANPLTAQFDVVHGLAVGIMLPHVIRFNAELPAVRRDYSGLLSGIVPSLENSTDLLTEIVAGYIQDFLGIARLPAKLSACGVTEEAIPLLAENAAKQWTAQFNPRPLTVEDFAALYRAAL